MAGNCDGGQIVRGGSVPCVWDEAKRLSNLAKHGLHFAAAPRFDWQGARYGADDRTDYGEERQIAVGLLDERLVVIVFTVRDGEVRIISMRKANPREMRRYDRK